MRPLGSATPPHPRAKVVRCPCEGPGAPRLLVLTQWRSGAEPASIFVANLRVCDAPVCSLSDSVLPATKWVSCLAQSLQPLEADSGRAPAPALCQICCNRDDLALVVYRNGQAGNLQYYPRWSSLGRCPRSHGLSIFLYAPPASIFLYAPPA